MPAGFANLRRASAEYPPRLIVYGDAGTGKSSLASEFPNHVFLQCEEGTPADAEITTLGHPDNFGEVMGAMRDLYRQQHDFQWFVTDSVTSLQQIIYRETCERGKKNSIEDFGYGKGYILCQQIWAEYIRAVNFLWKDRRMGIIFIGHSTVDRFDDPETVSYHKYDLDIHDKSAGLLTRDADAILLLKRPVHIKTEDNGFNKRAIGDGSNDQIDIIAKGKPAFLAKNRFGMPAAIEFRRHHGYEALKPYFPVLPMGGRRAEAGEPISDEEAERGLTGKTIENVNEDTATTTETEEANANG